MRNMLKQVKFRRVRTFSPTCLLMLFSLFVTLSALPGWGQYAPQQPQGQEAPPPPPPPPPDQGQYPAAEQPQAPPPYIAPQQLSQLVQRIALDPDSLLAQILTSSTVWEQIPDAAAWADQHAALHGDPLAAAIQEDNLQFDPSVMALLPFPQVLDMMAQDPGWMQQLGSAVLAQRNDVMDAIQSDRQQAYAYGYLRTNPYDSVVNDGNYIQILPVNPAYVYVPFYNPAVVFYRPQPGFVVGIGVRFGPAIVVGPAFRPWGWGTVGFAWGAHAIMIDHTPWNRVWANRAFYAHSYAHPYVHSAGPRVEHHEVRRDEHPR
jgi:hypothetical protein